MLGKVTMRAFGLVVGVALCATAAQAQVPSGQPVELYDLVIEPDTGTARFRFLMPGLGGLPYESVAADLPWLCENVALPELAANGWEAETVVISLGDRVVPLGQMDASAVQYFDAFGIGTGTCILEVF